MSGQHLHRGAAYSIAAARRMGSISSLQSNRTAPVTAPGLDLLWTATLSGVNGGTAVTPKKANVEWLNDDQKLIMPEGIYRAETIDLGDDYVQVARCFCTIVPAAPRQFATALGPFNGVVLTNDASVIANCAAPNRWADLPDPRGTPAARPTSLLWSIEVGAATGDNLLGFIPRMSEDQDSTAFLKYSYGMDPNDCFTIAAPVKAKTVSPTTLEQFYELPGAVEQASTALSALFLLNYSVRDRAFLCDVANRFADGRDVAALTTESFCTKLDQYTCAMIAALNVGRLNNLSFLAWTRAYGVAMGMLPAADSKHNIEFQLTCELPESSELKKVSDDHPKGEAAADYIRACYSLLAAFGMMHLANDHTWKPSDDNIKRRAHVVVNCLRTVLSSDMQSAISSDANIPVTIRTTAHPFGMASTWAAFKVGLANTLLAEPLMDRTTIVPPPVARVGLVVGVYGKMMSLPINAVIREKYGDTMDKVKALRTTVVEQAVRYSNLHRYYGFDDARRLTPEEEDDVNSLMPMIAAYSQSFEKDDSGQPSGAMLSQAVAKVASTEAGLVALYSEAFDKYVSKDHKIEDLIKGGDADTVTTAASTV